MSLPLPFAPPPHPHPHPHPMATVPATPPLRRALPIAALMLGTLSVCAAMAQGQRPPDRRGPPPEGYQACEGKTEGATVVLAMPDRKTLQGICRISPGAESGAGTLVAMPAERPPAGEPPPLR